MLSGRKVLLAFIAGLAAFAAFAVLARTVLHGPVSASALATSVERESDSAGQAFDGDERCREVEESIWRCAVADRQGSGGALYEVTLRSGSSCWDASIHDDYSEGGMPRRLDGCVYLWQWKLVDLVL